MTLLVFCFVLSNFILTILTLTILTLTILTLTIFIFTFLHFYIFLGRTSARPFRALLVLTIYQFFGELFGDLIFSSYICSILN